MLKRDQKPVMWHVRQAIAIDADTIKRKKVILVTSGLTAVFSLILAIFHLTRHTDVGTMQDHKEAIIDGYDFVTTGGLIYNQACLDLGQNKESGEFQDLYETIANLIRSEDDIKQGTLWSTVYLFNGVTLLLICFNAILMMSGAYFFFPRLFALIINLMLTIIHFCAIITTAVYRFRPLGTLCSLSIQPTKKDNLEWTYQSDATLIVVLWSLQFALFVPFCIAGLIPVLRRHRQLQV